MIRILFPEYPMLDKPISCLAVKLLPLDLVLPEFS